MKAEYMCEICGTKYPTEKAALLCEKRHKLEKKKNEYALQSSKAISEMVERHIRTFNELPEFELSEESRAILVGNTRETIVDIVNDFISELFQSGTSNTKE